LTELAAFQTKVRAVRVAPLVKRMQLAQQLVASEGNPPAIYPIVLASLLLRDSVDAPADWNIVLDFVHKLPNKLADEPEVQENRAFAAAQAGNNVHAIVELETLIQVAGPTPERLRPDGRPLQAARQSRHFRRGKAASPCQGDRLL
jgi:hypothetical protein